MSINSQKFVKYVEKIVKKHVDSVEKMKKQSNMLKNCKKTCR